MSILRLRRRSYTGFGGALVTGASSGIGAAMVRQLVRGGIHVVVVARRRDRLEALAEELVGQPGTVEVLVADLSTDDGLRSVVERIEDAERPLDLIVNNAGFGTHGALQEADPDRLEREIDTNVQALTRISHAALRTMLPRGRGHLVNVASIAGFQPVPRLAVYSATKAYVLSFSQALHEETRGEGVHVTTLCPGWTRTEFQSVSGSRHGDIVPGWAWSSADAVAAAGLRGVARGRAIVTPGIVNHVLGLLTSMAPRTVVRRATARALRQRG